MRIALHGFSLIFFAAVQATWINSIRIFDVVPNLFLIYIIVVSCFCGRKEGAIVGLIFGFVFDLMIWKIWGLYALFGMILGFSVAHFCEKVFGQKNIVLAILLVLVGTWVFEFIYYLFYFISVENIGLKYAFLRVILPEGVYNALLAVPLYLLIKKPAKYLYTDKGESIG